MSKRVGIITGGGDCPGLNTVIDAIVKTLEPEYEVLGFYKSFEGLLDMQYRVLTSTETDLHKFAGGSFLKTVNSGNFPGKVGLNSTAVIDAKVVEKTMQNYHSLGLEGVIVLGGDGSLSAAHSLQQAGMNIVGVPKSIDNDLLNTDFTFGFWTAVEIATDALDRLATTAFSHDRVMILEVMGRNAGWIGLYAGLAGGAETILIPELPINLPNLKKHLSSRPTKNTLVVVSEGASFEGEEQILSHSGGKSSQTLLGGVGDRVASELNSSGEFDARCARLGHLQRGGVPNSMDRVLSRQYGVFASELFLQGEFGKMVSYLDGKFTSTNLVDCIRDLKLVDMNSQIVESARKIGVYLG